MADLEQTSVEVQCSDGTFLNILLDAAMAEQLRNGQIFLTEENGQIGIQQQDGQICLLEYADQTDVAVENTENEPNNSKTIENNQIHIEENNRQGPLKIWTEDFMTFQFF